MRFDPNELIKASLTRDIQIRLAGESTVSEKSATPIETEAITSSEYPNPAPKRRRSSSRRYLTRNVLEATTFLRRLTLVKQTRLLSHAILLVETGRHSRKRMRSPAGFFW